MDWIKEWFVKSIDTENMIDRASNEKPEYDISEFRNEIPDNSTERILWLTHNTTRIRYRCNKEQIDNLRKYLKSMDYDDIDYPCVILECHPIALANKYHKKFSVHDFIDVLLTKDYEEISKFIENEMKITICDSLIMDDAPMIDLTMKNNA